MDGSPGGTPTEAEDGFTLIELLMVVLVVGILLAIAIPTYSGARDRAADRAVQGNLRNAFTATRILYNEDLEYTDDVARMTAIDASLTWTTTPLDGTSPGNAVYLEVADSASPGDAQVVVVGARSAVGHCFFLRDVMGGVDGGTYYDSDVSGAGTCVPPDPSAITGDRWSSR